MAESSSQMTPPQETTPPQHVTPPRQPGEIGGMEDGPRWPKIIGIISIVLGIGGCLGGVWGFLTPMLMRKWAEHVPPEQAAALGNVEAWGKWIAISSALTLLIALVLLVAGIALVKRRRYAIKLTRIWAVSKMLFALVSTYVGYIIQQEQFEQMSQQNPVLSGSPFVDIALVVGVAFGLVWGCAFPMFVLIWFSRSKVKAEYSQWS